MNKNYDSEKEDKKYDNVISVKETPEKTLEEILNKKKEEKIRQIIIDSVKHLKW